MRYNTETRCIDFVSHEINESFLSIEFSSVSEFDCSRVSLEFYYLRIL